MSQPELAPKRRSRTGFHVGGNPPITRTVNAPPSAPTPNEGLSLEEAEQLLRRYAAAVGRGTPGPGRVRRASWLPGPPERIVQAAKLILAHHVENGVLTEEFRNEIETVVSMLPHFVEDSEAFRLNCIQGTYEARRARNEVLTDEELRADQELNHFRGATLDAGVMLRADLSAFVEAVQRLELTDPLYRQRVYELAGFKSDADDLKNVFTTKLKSHELKECAWTIVWGIFALLVAFWFWHYLVGNPFDDLALIRRGSVVSGFIVDTSGDAEMGDRGGTLWLHRVVYTYRLPDGREFTQSTKDRSGPLNEELRNLAQPYPVEIEYLPDNPSVSRLKGERSDSVLDWLWRKAGLGGLLLMLFLRPGWVLLRNGFRDIRKLRSSDSNPRSSRAGY